MAETVTINGQSFLKRNPLGVLGLSIITLGIYHLYWHAKLFQELRMHRIMANYLPTNERSGSLLRRLGFKVEGYARDYIYINGAWRDHILTSLVNDDPVLPDYIAGSES